MASNLETLVTVFGGSGFLGRNVVRALAKREYRIRVAVRRPELAGHLQPLGRVGQIHAVQANLRYPASVEAAMRDSQVAINLVGILTESGAQTFDAVQAKGAETIAKTAGAAGARMVHVSAIGADENSPSAYGRAKASGEKAVLAAVPSATIMRPSLLFGPEDQFTNRFAALARISPFLPLIGGGVTRMQPAYVGDVAAAVANAVDGKTKARRDLRTRRTGSADHARDHGNHSRDHRAQAHADFAAVRAWRGCRRFPAVCAGAVEADAGPGGDAAIGQCGVGRRQGRGPHAGRARHHARIRCRRSPRNISGASAPPGSFSARARNFVFRRVGKGAHAPCPPSSIALVMVGTLRFAHPTSSEIYRPSASAIRPSVPRMTRHHAKSVNPWRVT